MILINERFISADHIEHIYIDDSYHPGKYVLIVQLSGSAAVFGSRDNDTMTMQMAFELRRRIVKAIIDYKSSDKPEIQHVDFPKYEEVHPREDSETQ